MAVEDTRRTMNAYVEDLITGGPYKRHFSDDVVVSLVGTDQGAEGPGEAEGWINYLHTEAFEAHQGLFPGVYTASLLAGEKSGNLEQVLRRYVSYVKVISAVRRKTISALVYPAILVALSVVVVTVIVVKVVPVAKTIAEIGKIIIKDIPG